MFQPVFVFDSQAPSKHLEVARAKGFRMVDIREVGSSVHGGNPAVIVYDIDLSRTLDRAGLRNYFMPPKNTGVMVMWDESRGVMSGHVRALPNPVEFVEWFFDRRTASYNGLTGKFKLQSV